MKKILISIAIVIISSSSFGDVLDPDFYENEETIKSYIREIRDGVKTGVGHAEEFKKDLGSMKADQLKTSERSLKNSYEIKILALEQGVIKKRVELLEVQGRETRKLLSLLSKGVEKSLRFVNGFYGLFGWLAGVICTVAGGLIVIYVKKYLIKKKRLDNE